MRIGERLQLIRKSVGFTQEVVAEKMNITRQTLSNWELDKNLPDIYSIACLANLYKFSLDEFLLGKSYFKGVQAMKTNYSDAQIENIIKENYPDAHGMQPLSGGLVSQTFSFDTNNEKVVFQIGGKSTAYEKEKLVSERYGNILPVRIIKGIYSTNSNCISYCFSSYIEGNKLFDLNDQERIDIVPSVLKFISQIASLDVAENVGYGHYDEKGKTIYKSWQEFISAVLNDKLYNWKFVEEKGIDITIINRAITEIKKHLLYTDIKKPYLIHGDLGSYNLLALNGTITGAIDWSLSLYGDYLYDISNILFWDEKKLQPLIKSINNKYLSDEINRRKILCYILRIGLEEVYNTVVLNEIGYDVSWVINRINEVTTSFM
jgi:transcriptional regulator with XRE-family HTH domain